MVESSFDLPPLFLVQNVMQKITQCIEEQSGKHPRFE